MQLTYVAAVPIYLIQTCHTYVLWCSVQMYCSFVEPEGVTVQIQHPYANSPAFPSNLYQRTVQQYDLDYQHQIMVVPRRQDMVLPQQRIQVTVTWFC